MKEIWSNEKSSKKPLTDKFEQNITEQSKII